MTAVYQDTIYKQMVYQLAICLSCFTRFCENVMPSSKVTITKIGAMTYVFMFKKLEIGSNIFRNILIRQIISFSGNNNRCFIKLLCNT